MASRYHGVAVFRVRRLAAPTYHGEHFRRPAPRPKRRSERSGEATDGPTVPVQQLPTSVLPYPYTQGIADQQRGDGAVHPVAVAAAPGESQIDILKGRPDMALIYRLRARRKFGSLTSDRRGVIDPFGVEAPESVEARERQRLPRLSHGHVVQTARRVGIRLNSPPDPTSEPENPSPRGPRLWCRSRWSAGWRGPGRPRSSEAARRRRRPRCQNHAAGLSGTPGDPRRRRRPWSWRSSGGRSPATRAKRGLPSAFAGVERSAWTSSRARSSSGGAGTSRQCSAQRFRVRTRIEAVSSSMFVGRTGQGLGDPGAGAGEREGIQ